MTVSDMVYQLFGQAVPSLDADVRADIVDCLHDCDYDVAAAMLLQVIRKQQIIVDPALLKQVQQMMNSDEV